MRQKITTTTPSKLITLFTLSFLIIASIFYACKKTESSNPEPLIKDEKAISALKKAYGYDNFDILATSSQKNQIISSARKNSTSFNQISSELNLNNVRLFTNSADGVDVVIFTYLNNIDKSFALKGSFKNGSFLIDNEAYVENVKAEGKTQTLISKNDEYFLLNTENNIESVQTVNFGSKGINLIDFKSQLKESLLNLKNTEKFSVLDDKYGNHGGNGFCQRERGESFSQCFTAEKDEFCEDFFTCLGSNISPPINVLIALACSCSASQSD